MIPLWIGGGGMTEERLRSNQPPDKRPERGVTRGDGAMRGGCAGRWEVVA
jgi:hypothetical protein